MRGKSNCRGSEASSLADDYLFQAAKWRFSRLRSGRRALFINGLALPPLTRRPNDFRTTN